MRTPPPLVVLVLGGAAERWACPDAESPLATADTPHLDRLAETGRVFGVRFAGEPSSAAPLLSLLGLDPAAHECAAASYQAALGGVELAAEECVLSADFVAVFRDMIADAQPGPLRPAEAAVLLDVAGAAIRRAGFLLLPGSGTHHLAVAPRASVDARTPAPMYMLGRKLDNLEPRVDQHAFAHRLGRDALDGHEINEVRRDLGANGADMLWLWGPGGTPHIAASFDGVSAFGAGAVWRGVCHVAGIEVKATKAKSVGGLVRAVGQALATDRICYVHDERSIRAAQRREATTRVHTVATIDEDLVGPLAKVVQRRGARLLIVPDAAWSTDAGHPLPDAVPALLWGAGINTLSARPFTEAAAAGAGEPVTPGHGLLAYVQRF